MKQGVVSILVVSYNAEKYIEKTLRSCLVQTYPDFEILVLDNASNDRTVELIRNLNDSRIILFEGRDNIGPYAGLNFLLDKANGEYIAIQDHDDIWLPEKLGKQIEFLKNNPEFIACGTNTFYYFEKRKILILNEKPEVADFVDHTSLVFRNKEFRYDSEHTLADEFFEKKTLSKAGKIGCDKNPLTIHRIKGDGTNLSSSRFSLSRKHLRDFFSVNAISFASFLYLFDLMSREFFPEKLLWFLRKKITLRNAKWTPLETFQKQFPETSL
jgi:glycosyltransferase involved in cell wall biosynthesis